MENRGIVYTFAANTDLNYCQHYHQILYSIATIRKFTDIPVKLFLSPRGIINTASMRADFMFPNVEIIEFDNDIDALYPSYIHEGYAEKLDHRWINVMRAFEMWNFDRVLFLDGDTFFNRSPHELFDKYPDICLWARLDVTSDLMKAIGLPDGINDGQFIISRKIYDTVQPGFRERHKHNVNQMLIDAEGKLSPHDHRHLHWLSSQYAALKTFSEYGVYIGHFSPEDVSLSTEPAHKHERGEECTMTSIMHHYFFGNTPRYLPRFYWSAERVQEFENAIANRTLCEKCGHLSY